MSNELLVKAEKLNTDDFNSLINFLYTFRIAQKSIDSIQIVKILYVLSEKFNQYPAICCNIWYNIAGYHLDSCINKMDVYK